MTEHTVRFAGRRIGRLIEKPWVIVPSGQNPDGSLREYRRGKTAYTGAQQRWNDISDALTAEADKTGRDGRGERPVIGEYLESLAQLSMPKEIEDMQKAGSTKFGILDVVIIWGMGNKDGPEASYIVEPTPIRNDGFTTFNSDQSTDRTPVQSLPKTPCTAPNSRSKGITNAESIKGDSDTTTVFPQTLTPTRITTPNTKTNPTTPSPPEKRPHPALQPEEPRRRPRGHYWDILTTKQTLCEQFSSIATATDSDPRTDHSPTSFVNHARITRPSIASTAGSSPLSSAPTTTRDPTPAQTKIVKFKTPSPINSAATSSVTNATRMKDKEADSEFLIPLRERTPAPRSKRRERVPTQPSAETLDREFVTPALSADCGVTYAPAGILRNVGAARAGVFREGGVVMGARFVVGG